MEINLNGSLTFRTQAKSKPHTGVMSFLNFLRGRRTKIQANEIGKNQNRPAGRFAAALPNSSTDKQAFACLKNRLQRQAAID